MKMKCSETEDPNDHYLDLGQERIAVSGAWLKFPTVQMAGGSNTEL